MRYRFSLPVTLSVCTLLALGSTPASADTMYKCVDAAGKVAYTSMPCPGKASVAKAFTVDAPLDDKALAEAEKNRIRQLNDVKAGIAKRAAERGGASYADATPYNGGGGIVRVPDKPKPQAPQKSAEQAERDLQRERRAERCGALRRQQHDYSAAGPRGC